MIQNVDIRFDLAQSEITVTYDERMDELVALFLDTERFRKAGFSVRLPGRYLEPIDCAKATTGASPLSAPDAPCTPEASAPFTPEASAPSAPATITSDDNGSQASLVTPTKLDSSVSFDSLYAEDPLIDPISGSDVSAAPRKRTRVIYDDASSKSDSSESCFTPSTVAGEKPSGRPRGSLNDKSVRKEECGTEKSQLCIENEVVLKELERLNSNSEAALLDACLEQNGLRPPIECDGGHQCCECHQIFNYLKNARRHMITHHSVKPFSCILCKAAFCRKHVLRHHLAGHLRSNGSEQKISVKDQFILKYPDMAEFMQEMCSLLGKYTHQDVFHVCAALVKQRWPEFEINETHARPHGWPNEVPYKGLDNLNKDNLVLLASILACNLTPARVVVALATQGSLVPCNLKESIKKLKGCRLVLTPEQGLFCASLLAYSQNDLAHLCIKLVAGLLGIEQARYPYSRGIRPPFWPADVRFARPFVLNESAKVCLASKIASQLTPDELNSALTSIYETKNGRGQIKLADEMVERLNSVKRQALGLN